MVEILLCAWLSWCLFNAALLFAGPYLMDDSGVYTNGFTTAFPQSIRDRLTPEQQAAIQAHEDGHKFHRHALKNLARLCFFVPRSDSTALQQEIEADNYAARMGHARNLASALRLLSENNVDHYRAALLER